MRTLGIDYGTRRLGLAISDDGGRFATPHSVVQIHSPKQAHQVVREVVIEESIERVVIGLPLNMDNSVGPAASGVVEWAKNLNISPPILFVDERLSSFEAEESLTARRRAGERLTRDMKKARRDALAAALILQRFLDGDLQPIIEINFD